MVDTKQKTQEVQTVPNKELITTIIPDLQKWSLIDVVNPQNANLLDESASMQRLITDNGAPSIGGHNS